MYLKINRVEFHELLENINILEQGDSYEREYFPFLKDPFPNYESFWKWFVVPLTRRMESNSNIPWDGIPFRDDMDPRLKQIAAAHYSLFMHLDYAHWHLKHSVPSRLENVYAHLGTACDLVETILENLYIVFLQAQGKQSKVLEKLSKEEFFDLTGNWYEKNYENLFNHYFSKGKFISIKIPNSKYIVSEYLSGSSAWKDLDQYMNLIRPYRNKIVHATVLGRIISSDNTTYIPKLDKISEFPDWDAVSAAANDPQKMNNNFLEMGEQTQTSLQGLEERINLLWGEIIVDFKKEFFSRGTSTLRNQFRIRFSDEPRVDEEEALIMNNNLTGIQKVGLTSSATTMVAITTINEGFLPGSANFPTTKQ